MTKLNATGFGRKPKKKKTRPRSPQHQRPRHANMSSKKLRKILAPLEKAAEERDELKAEWKERVHEISIGVMEASEAGVPLKDITEAAKITRQYFYAIERNYKAGKLNESKSHDSNIKDKKFTKHDRNTASKKSSPRNSNKTDEKANRIKRTIRSDRGKPRTSPFK